MTAPDKPGLSNEEFIEKWRKYLRGDRDDTGEQIIYNLRVLPEALDRLEALIGQGKPTPGQIGGEEALKFQDAQTLAAYWVMSDSENRRKMWESDLKKICEALLSVTGQGEVERLRALLGKLVSASKAWCPECIECGEIAVYCIDDVGNYCETHVPPEDKEPGNIYQAGFNLIHAISDARAALAAPPTEGQKEKT